MRTPVLIAALSMIMFFGLLTLDEIVQHGLDVLTVVSVIVLAMFAFGIVGALRHPPE